MTRLTCGRAVARALLWCSVAALPLAAQRPRLLRLDPADAFGGPLPVDRGASGVRQRLLELRTLASVMQVTAHPDDEQAGLLTYFSRGTGARVALLTLNRGEAGANAVGSELFDALGLLRSEELLLADRYYGVDDQYFTTAADYGFSKTIAEAARSWDTTAVLRDMVRIIRTNRPVVVIARWYGGARDGHGHHQFAGAIAPLAVAAAADSTRFPELVREGLRPWKVRRLFRANIREGERAEVVIDAGRFDPWLGESYQAFGADGYSRQRSQTSGRRGSAIGPSLQRLQLLSGDAVVGGDDPFAGLPLALPALFTLTGETAPGEVMDRLRAAAEATGDALSRFNAETPWGVVPRLLDALRALRAAEQLTPASAYEARLLLAVKIRQCERAIVAALGTQVTAVAGASDRDGDPVTPGAHRDVQLAVTIARPEGVVVGEVALASKGAAAERIERPNALLTPAAPFRATLSLDVPADAEPSRPPLVRDGIAQNHYRRRDGAADDGARSDAPFVARLTLLVDGTPITVERTVRYRQSREPREVVYPRLTIVPPVAVHAQPAVQVVTRPGLQRAPVTVEVAGMRDTPVDAEVLLQGASGNAVAPAQRVRLARGERRTLSFVVTLPEAIDSLAMRAVARVDGREWRDDVTPIVHEELEPAALYADATATIRRIPVRIAPGLRVAYVMGVGDLVPEAIAQLGAHVTLLDAPAVAAGDFSRFDAVVIGTRAYAVRPELAAATSALTAYARRGGNVVVLYQTQEWKPETMAPYRALLPDDAEETTEEDAPVTLLAARDALLTTPNRLTAADFTGWIEQRGSKFLTELAPEYTPLVETHDTGQPPQRGVWVTARVGSGRWSYVALALHRQLPYGVAGAYRILANLLTRPAPAAR